MGQNDGPKASIGVSGYIWAILLEFRPFCLDLGHFAKIWAILLGFGRIWVRISPKGDEALMGGTDGRMDVWMDRFPLCSRGLCPLWGRCPKNRPTHGLTEPPTKQGVESRSTWLASHKALFHFIQFGIRVGSIWAFEWIIISMHFHVLFAY